MFKSASACSRLDIIKLLSRLGICQSSCSDCHYREEFVIHERAYSLVNIASDGQLNHGSNGGTHYSPTTILAKIVSRRPEHLIDVTSAAFQWRVSSVHKHLYEYLSN